jgi:hypothetical protein
MKVELSFKSLLNLKMSFKILLLFSILKIAFSAIEDIKVVSSNIDTETKDHVISTVFALFEKQTDLKTFAKSLAENMDNNYGKSWICQVLSHNCKELFSSQQLDNFISITYNDYKITLFKMDIQTKTQVRKCLYFFPLLCITDRNRSLFFF